MGNVLAAFAGQASKHVSSAIQSASARTGVDFAYLMQQAKAESSFNSNAKAKTSSATGLYQFIDSTWLSMIEKHGDKHGVNTQGMSKDDILALRNDAKISSVMAAEFANDNHRFLQAHWGGEIGSTELYFAHFLGAGQAASFLQARDENGMKAAADLFPAAAKANRNVFYDRATGRAKSLDEVYAFFDAKFQIKGEEVTPETVKDYAVKSYEDPVARLDDALTKTMGEKRRAAEHFIEQSYVFTRDTGRPSMSFGDLIAQPLELLLLTQTMDLPINRQNDDFQLFSTRKLF